MNQNKKYICEQVKKDLEILIDEFKDLAEIAKQGLETFDNFQSSNTQYVFEGILDEITRLNYRIFNSLTVVKMAIIAVKEEQEKEKRKS